MLDDFYHSGFSDFVFIFIIIFATFRLICFPAFFKCFLSNFGVYTELRTSSFTKSTKIACSDSVNHNRVQVLSFPILLLACSQDWACNLRMIVTKKLREPTPITFMLCVLLQSEFLGLINLMFLHHFELLLLSMFCFFCLSSYYNFFNLTFLIIGSHIVFISVLGHSKGHSIPTNNPESITSTPRNTFSCMSSEVWNSRLFFVCLFNFIFSLLLLFYNFRFFHARS